MIIEAIELQDYRNYDSLSLRLNPGTNIFYGDNAQGKTNLLEAVFMASTSKSYRMSRDRDLIRFGAEEAHIKMTVRKRGVPYRIDLHLKKNKTKGIAIDEVPIRKASELFGIANVVCFSPEDLSLIKDGPAMRRRFLDLELCQLDRLYLHDLTCYNRVLNQRNRLLRDILYKPSLQDTLSAWDKELTDYGGRIIEARARFIERLGRRTAELHSSLSGGRERLILSYEQSVSAAEFGKKLTAIRAAELRQHISLLGPHRDDIRFMINERDIRKFGSQGQQRTAALSLKLSEIELVRELLDDSPILLLDDVLSELDSKRQNYLLKTLRDTQNIITCTGLDDFIENRFHIDALFRVEEGRVETGMETMPQKTGQSRKT